MKIIATTNNGFLIEATKQEVNDIMSATIGNVPDKIGVDTIIPAHDYAASVRACKSFKNTLEYKYLKEYAQKSSKTINSIIDKFESLGTEN